MHWPQLHHTIKSNSATVTNLFLCLAVALISGAVAAQIPPSSSETARYAGLFRAALHDQVADARALLSAGESPQTQDHHGRTPLHVAAYHASHAVMRALVAAGADPNALEHDRYDILTIAAVANDLDTVRLALSLGTRPGNVTSRYDGTALIAAAHLGHVEVVRTIAAAGAPLDHVNNLGWTALIEAIVLGDGGDAHTATVKVLVAAGANVNLADSEGATPLQLARSRRYDVITNLLQQAGAK